ncbi:MAG: DUF58 domain-containing protein [Deltaproteobacteria bacterium]|nr:DUF58 domain-containing protein [Deltaproteobacteria bacterium]
MLKRAREALRRWDRSPFVERPRRWLGRLTDLIPVTPLGLVVALTCYATLQRYGYRQRDLVLFAIGALGVLLVLVGVVVTVVGALLVWRKVRRLPGEGSRRLECNRWSATGHEVPSFWYVPLLTLEWRWRGLDVELRQAIRGRRIVEEVRPRRRAEATSIVRRYEIGDAFGLARIAFEVREVCDVALLPSVGALRQMQVIHGLASGSDRSDVAGKAEGDPFDTRRYAPGDPIRFVLWKVYAKSRQLIVRTPERATSPVDQTVAYLVTGKGDEPAAGAARVAVDLGAFGDEWRIGADGVAAEARTRDEALALLTRSADAAESQSGAGLARFVEEAGTLGRLVVFVPPRPGPWLARVSHAVKELRGRVDFVIGTDGIDRTSRLSRALERDVDTGRGVPFEELARVVRGLGASAQGSRVVVVDRRSGQAYLPEHLFGGRPR